MNIKRERSLVVLCVVLLRTTCALVAAPAPGTLLDKIVANVDNQIILQSELDIACQQYLLQGGKESSDLKCKVLDQLIANKMLLSKAKREKIVVDKETVEQALSERMHYFLAQARSEEMLVRYWGKPIEKIKSELRETIEEQLMIDKIRAPLLQNISATPQEVKEFFVSIPAEERPYYPAEVTAREIVQYPKVRQQDKDVLITQLEALKIRLQNGEDFDVLAQEYSQDPISASQGGDLGFCRLGELDPAYEAVALALQPGEISDPIATQSGYHLIQLIAREENRYNSRHILLKYGEGVLDIEAVKKKLAQLRADILAGKVTFAQAAIQSSESSLTAPSGGLLTGGDGGVRMLIDSVSPDVYFAIEQLTPGAISDPVSFTTTDGREAVRIVLLEEQSTPHQANLTQDYEKIQQLLVTRKRAIALQEWLEHVRDDTSIHVAPEYQNCELRK